jgi:hypothetical protein
MDRLTPLVRDEGESGTHPVTLGGRWGSIQQGRCRAILYLCKTN